MAGFVGRAIAVATLVVACGGALAAEHVTTRTYSISGDTGEELLASMQRKGPRHGFLSRAIAQTAYTVKWDAKVATDGKSCRVIRAKPILDMTYSFPEPSERLSPQMRPRWATFMVGVRKHEGQHGAMARAMVRAAESAVKSVRMADDPDCRKTGREVKLRADAIYETYEARQRAFDMREHRDKGNIERLIRALIKE